MPQKHARLAWLPYADSARLVWTFFAPVEDGIPYAPVIVLDANTGELIERYNAVQFDRQATVNEFNPVKTPTPVTVQLSDLAQNSTNLTDGHVNVMNCIDKQTTKTFYGITVHSCELEQHAQADSNGDFTSYTKGSDTAPEDSYAEVSMFYHVSKAYDFLQALGLLLDDVEHRLAECPHQFLGVDRANALDHARGEVLLDALGGRRRR